MIDFHTHILPKMDDGSKTVEESIKMLSSYPDYVTDVFLTPHFNPRYESPSSFLLRRKEAFNNLCEEIKKSQIKTPSLHLGAEVAFYDGINNSEEIKDLIISGTNLLLVEMPHGIWTKRMLQELINLKVYKNVVPVLAHFDRYGFITKNNKEIFDYYISNGGLVQVNTSALYKFFERKKFFSLLYKNKVHFLGTDAHNTNNRKPDFDIALNFLKKNYQKTISIIQNNENFIAFNNGGII